MGYVVIKYGGSIMDGLHPSFYENIVMMMEENHVKPVIVHGGGPEISKMLDQLKIETRFIEGMRVTTNEVLDVVEMVLSGTMNKTIVRNLMTCGGHSIGLSGVDGMLLEAGPIHQENQLGFVGKVHSVNTKIIERLLDEKLIPVISPVATDKHGGRWNVNADLAAAAIAKALQAPLCLVTNVPGILKNGKVLSNLSHLEVQQLLDDGTITGGMIPKVKAALDCLHEGIREVVILDGTEENALKRFIGKEKIGTSINLELTYAK
ncbi:acetylglutamate kinase [Caldifermentibacillus hisashii]|uniref:acetylglutamate kinase n=1 Tax=Caldifermentibacillus hisashii TaxID=996558 RepID=UPI002E220FBC|nr:acetylglutamate kinase [Caldifermentibacillus hisashii]MED4852336.1 acetylglutamate kinase [Caldifermentibacillus hisashii]